MANQIGSIGGFPNLYNLSSSSLSIEGGVNTMPTPSPAIQSVTGLSLPQTILGQPFAILVGMIVLLIGFKFLSEHEKVDLDPAHLHIGAYNVLAVGITASVFIVSLKALTIRYPVVPALTMFANYI